MRLLIKSLCLLACSQSVMAAPLCNSLQQLEWMLGDWQSFGEKSDTHESWLKLSEQTFEGKGTSFNKQGQLKSSENLRLLAMQDAIYFLAKVSHNELPVAFKATRCDANHAVFENPKHDFPNKLEYSLTPDGTLMVKVRDLENKGFSLVFIPNKKAD